MVSTTLTFIFLLTVWVFQADNQKPRLTVRGLLVFFCVCGEGFLFIFKFVWVGVCGFGLVFLFGWLVFWFCLFVCFFPGCIFGILGFTCRGIG